MLLNAISQVRIKLWTSQSVQERLDLWQILKSQLNVLKRSLMSGRLQSSLRLSWLCQTACNSKKWGNFLMSQFRRLLNICWWQLQNVSLKRAVFSLMRSSPFYSSISWSISSIQLRCWKNCGMKIRKWRSEESANAADMTRDNWIYLEF